MESPLAAATVVQPSGGKRLAGIEGLRALAATGVLVAHTTVFLSNPEVSHRIFKAAAFGGQGLTLFFVLSGFLLYTPFAASLVSGTRTPRIGPYFRNRGLRIFPAYLVILLFVALVLPLANRVTPAFVGDTAAIGRITDPATWITNIFLVQTYFPSTNHTGLGVAWSLTTEIAFYLVLPLLCVGAAFLVRHRVARLLAAALPAILMVFVGIAGSIFVAAATSGLTAAERHRLSWGQSWMAVFDRSLLSQADLFGYGMAAALVVAVLRARNVTRSPLWLKLSLGAVALAISVVSATKGGPYASNVMGIAAAFLVLIVVLPSHKTGQSTSTVARFLEFLPLRYLGLISFSTYLWHEPVIWWLRTHGLYDSHTVSGFVWANLTVLALTTVLASLTYFLIEKPAMNLKKRG